VSFGPGGGLVAGFVVFEHQSVAGRPSVGATGDHEFVEGYDRWFLEFDHCGSYRR